MHEQLESIFNCFHFYPTKKFMVSFPNHFIDVVEFIVIAQLPFIAVCLAKQFIRFDDDLNDYRSIYRLENENSSTTVTGTHSARVFVSSSRW